MAVVLKTSGLKRTDVNPEYPVSEDQVRKKLTTKAIEVIQEIARDHDERLSAYKGNIHLLDNGIYYPNEYFKALQLMKQSKRIQFLVQNGSFFHGVAPSQHFTMSQNCEMPTGVVPLCFILKQGVSPCAALGAIRRGISFMGCGETCQIAYYEAIREVLGDEKFNFLFSANSSTPLKLHYSTQDNPLLCVLQDASPSKISKGQMIYFQNSELYPFKHMLGEAQGYSTLCCDDTLGQEKFTGLGLRPEGTTCAGLNQILIECFNADPGSLEIVSSVIGQSIFQKLYSAGQISMFRQNRSLQLLPERFTESGGGKILGAYELNSARITLLANSSFDEARQLLDKWKQSLHH
jgi:hypothetical protein